MTKITNSGDFMKNPKPWVFTAEQIVKIKNKDKDAIRKFFEDNYKIICFIAYRFLRQKSALCPNYYCLTELVNQFYVDLPYFSFNTRSTFYNDIFKRCFFNINDGGILAKKNTFLSSRNSVSYNNPIGDDDTSCFLDLISCDKSLEDIYFNRFDDRQTKDDKIIALLVRTIPNKKDLNKMFCRLFTDLKPSEIKGDEYEEYISRNN